MAKDETAKHAQQLKAARADAALHAQQIRALEQQAQQQAQFLQEQAEEHAQQLKTAKAAVAHHVGAAQDKEKQESQTASCLGCISTACKADSSVAPRCCYCSLSTSDALLAAFNLAISASACLLFPVFLTKHLFVLILTLRSEQSQLVLCFLEHALLQD